MAFTTGAEHVIPTSVIDHTWLQVLNHIRFLNKQKQNKYCAVTLLHLALVHGIL
jgi:hypothetical protein